MQNLQVPPVDGGSKPTPSLQFSVCSLKDVSAFVKQHHYSKTHHKVVVYAFSLTMNGLLAGACLFGMAAGNIRCMTVLTGHDNPRDYLELQRLVLLDEVPKNSESRFIGWCLRWLKKNTGVKAVISFADPAHGHGGTVYRASNWIYTGKQKPARDRIYLDGVEMHPKQFYNIYGTSSLPKLRALLPDRAITTGFRETKHRYVFVLKTELMHLLKLAPKDWA
jgi:hypothetical protein